MSKSLLKSIYFIMFKGYKFNSYPYFVLLLFHHLSRRGVSNLISSINADSIYCLGNGPSLNKENLTLLSSNTIIYTNSSYLLDDKINPSNRLIVFTDYIRYKDAKKTIPHEIPLICSINTFDNKVVNPWLYWKTCFILPHHDIHYNHENKSISIVTINNSLPIDIKLNRLAINFSVIFSAIQIAYTLGAKHIGLLGVDMNYTSPKSHFDKSIKPLWNEFNYEIHARPSFEYYLKHLKEKGIELVNYTCETAEDVLPKSSLS